MTSPGGAIRQLATVYPHAMRARAWMGAHPWSAAAREEYAAAMGTLAAARREAAPQVERVRAALGDAAADALAEVYLNGAAPPLAAGRLDMTAAQVEGHIRDALAFLDGPGPAWPKEPPRRPDPDALDALAALAEEHDATMKAVSLIRRNRERNGIPYATTPGQESMSPPAQVKRWNALAALVAPLADHVRETLGDAHAQAFTMFYVRCRPVYRIALTLAVDEATAREIIERATRAAARAARESRDAAAQTIRDAAAASAYET